MIVNGNINLRINGVTYPTLPGAQVCIGGGPPVYGKDPQHHVEVNGTWYPVALGTHLCLGDPVRINADGYAEHANYITLTIPEKKTMRPEEIAQTTTYTADEIRDAGNALVGPLRPHLERLARIADDPDDTALESCVAAANLGYAQAQHDPLKGLLADLCAALGAPSSYDPRGTVFREIQRLKALESEYVKARNTIADANDRERERNEQRAQLAAVLGCPHANYGEILHRVREQKENFDAGLAAVRHRNDLLTKLAAAIGRPHATDAEILTHVEAQSADHLRTKLSRIFGYISATTDDGIYHHVQGLTDRLARANERVAVLENAHQKAEALRSRLSSLFGYTHATDAEITECVKALVNTYVTPVKNIRDRLAAALRDTTGASVEKLIDRVVVLVNQRSEHQNSARLQLAECTRQLRAHVGPFDREPSWGDALREASALVKKYDETKAAHEKLRAGIEALRDNLSK